MPDPAMPRAEGQRPGFHLQAQKAGQGVELHRVKESRRVWVWGIAIPLVALVMTFAFGAGGMIVLLVYPLQFIRIAISGNNSSKNRWWNALFLVLGKFPEAVGQINYFYNKWAGKTAHLIEYK